MLYRCKCCGEETECECLNCDPATFSGFRIEFISNSFWCPEILGQTFTFDDWGTAVNGDCISTIWFDPVLCIAQSGGVYKMTLRIYRDFVNDVNVQLIVYTRFGVPVVYNYNSGSNLTFNCQSTFQFIPVADFGAIVEASPASNPECVFYCQSCDDGFKESLPGCAIVTVNSITWDVTQCRDLDLCNDFFGGPFIIQGVAGTDGFGDPVCDFLMTNPCNCVNMGYAPVLAYGPNGPKQGVNDGITCKVSFRMKVEPTVYRISHVNFAGNDVNPGAFASTTAPRADPNECTDFPLSWLGIPCELNLNPGFFKVPRHCYDGLGAAPVAASCDIVFLKTGCDDSLSLACQSGDLTPACHWNTDGLNPGWCQDRAPLSYNKYLDTIDVVVPDNFDGNGTLGGAFQMTPRSIGGAVMGDFINNPAGGIIWADWRSSIFPGTVPTLLLRSPQGFGQVTNTFLASTSSNGCGTNYGHDCAAFEDTYTGTFVNCTVSNATELP